jgi:DNA-directed RNA polymerase specialized sigma24 family protein
VDDERALLDRALMGDAAATRALIVAVLPVIQVRVSRVLSRRRARSGRDVRQEVEDLAQEVFAALFENDGRVLRAWDPSRGLSLASFCGLIAERETASILRSGRRSPWTEDATASEDLERDAGTTPDAELRVASREHLTRLTDRLREELSPRGLEMFQRLIVEEETVESVCGRTGMTADAVYAWRSRVGKLARKLATELVSSEPHMSARQNTSQSSATNTRTLPKDVSEIGTSSRRSSAGSPRGGSNEETS